MKFIGIFAIYLGHFGESAGLSYEFSFKFHVPMFFFIAGCTESITKDIGTINGIKKKTKTLIVPWLIFTLLSSSIMVIANNLRAAELKSIMIMIIKGTIRNTFFAYSLWFLTCLYVVSILFIFLKKLKNNWLILVVSVLCHVISDTMLPYRPIVQPTMIFNIDSALYYMIYFAIGYVSFQKINKLLANENRIIKVLRYVSILLTFAYTFLIFFGKDILQMIYSIPIIGIFKSVITSVIIIWFFVNLAYFLKEIAMFNSIGQHTLYLCGSEYMIKLLVSECIGILALNITINTPLAAYIYTFLLLCLVCRYLVPIEKSIINKINNYI